MRIHRVLAVLMGGAILLSAGCRRSEKLPVAKAANPVWTEFIESRTDGIVSAKSPITVVFSRDVFTPDQVGKPGQSILKTEPGIAGETSITSPREIVLVPKADLEQGAYYLVRLYARGIKDLPPDAGNYEFTFRVISQDYEVRLEGLETVLNDPSSMTLAGTLVTADAADNAAVEKMLKAKADGSTSLATVWEHNAVEKKHAFTLSGIKRADAASRLVLDFSGSPLGMKGGDTRQELEVPGRKDFKVADVKARQGAEQYIVVYFSDPLDPSQNLNGLVSVNRAGFSLQREGNTVKLMPRQRVAGKVSVTVARSVRNASGARLDKDFIQEVAFTSQNPQVRFAGKGLILPDSKVLTVPFEAVNLKSVQVTAFRIFEGNVGAYFQSNDMDGQQDLHRVGRYLWRKTIALPSLEADEWLRYHIDVTDLLNAHKGEMFRLEISFNRSNSNFSCSEEDDAVPVRKEPALVNQVEEGRAVALDSGLTAEHSYWEEYNWEDRDNPCKDSFYVGYYSQGQASVRRTFLASNLGLLAKRDQTGELVVAVTDLKTAAPVSGARVTVFDYQNQKIAEGSSDGQGFASFRPDVIPFYARVDKDGDVGYLKVNQGGALSVSHFDAGGEKVQAGVKGAIYGERDVWRPGDPIHLVFVREDKVKALPPRHPVTLQLFSPQGQVMETVTNSQPVGDFYRFTLKTAESAPTGAWRVRVQLGNRSFEKALKIETIAPNRLKIDLDMKGESLKNTGEPLAAELSSAWLHGAPASGLKAEVEVSFAPAKTQFEKWDQFTFDDPAREIKEEPSTIFSGDLNGEGKAVVLLDFEGQTSGAPGALRARFRTRVYEPGGAFSVSHRSALYYPYRTFVGVNLAAKEMWRGMVVSGQEHTLHLAALTSEGKPASVAGAEVSLHRVEWRWWWDRGQDSLAQFVANQSHAPVASAKVDIRNGRGEWKFSTPSTDWGRYLLRVCDPDGGHCAGTTFYVGYKGWWYDGGDQGQSADVLYLSLEKPEYAVGETAVIELPKEAAGRALVTVETGSRLLQKEWVDFSSGGGRYKLRLTPEMTPNVYVSVTLLQKHGGKDNDRPIRLFGVTPVKVTDPKTVLEPVVQAQDEWRPKAPAVISVSEKSGRAMAYTVAVVDEGLLGLTDFKTPDLHSEFYRKEALGVSTWDLFDLVLGGYGGEIERLLSIGGDGFGAEGPGRQEEKRRFPPVVEFLGPFELGAKKTNEHTITLPQYAGQVRVMVVAAKAGAYGKTDKSVYVREPLMILPTMPRVVSVGESFEVPVSVFATGKEVGAAELSLAADDHFTVEKSPSAQVSFGGKKEQMVLFSLKSLETVGQGWVEVKARSGDFKTESKTFLSVRSPNPPTVKQYGGVVLPGKTWEGRFAPHGLPGTNEVSLEVTSIPPLNLEARLGYLVRYPHGCVEQTVSSVFPQLYLASLMDLPDARKTEIQNNISAGIDRLKQFQNAAGGFVYWPGVGEYDAWATNYAGHFLVEAKNKGHFVPPDMLSNWKKHQSARANSDEFEHDTGRAYRLYTLALAGEPALGAMNRLKEKKDLNNTARWFLAGAYVLAGQKSAAQDVANQASLGVSGYDTPGFSYGSPLRDKGVILDVLARLGDQEKGFLVAEDISKSLVADDWHSTQTLAYTLMAMARFFAEDRVTGGLPKSAFAYEAGGAPVEVKGYEKSLFRKDLPDFPAKETPVKVVNKGEGKLFVRFTARGVPRSGEEGAASSGLQLTVATADGEDRPLDPSGLKQGEEVTVETTIKNTSGRRAENIALTQMAAAGWEVVNPRMEGRSAVSSKPLDYQDVRDDRVLSYFSLDPGETLTLKNTFHATFRGRFYFPGAYAEAMYDASVNGRTAGTWVTVLPSQE